MKIIEGMKDWEVQKAAEEGKTLCSRLRGAPSDPWVLRSKSHALLNWRSFIYAVVDESTTGTIL